MMIAAHRLPRWLLTLSAVAFFGFPHCFAQNPLRPDPVDPTAGIGVPRLQSAVHQPLPERYIWLGRPGGKGSETEWNADYYLRRSFNVASKPTQSTLYVAGPELIRIYLNGRQLANAQRDPSAKARPFVLSFDVSSLIQSGKNTLAIYATHGDRLLAKIVPAQLGIAAPALVVSDQLWKASSSAPPEWQGGEFNDSQWGALAVSEPIESDIDYLQWTDDTQLYRWPGYDGISPFLAHVSLGVQAVQDVFEGLGRFTNVEAITQASGRGFTVEEPSSPTIPEQYPSMLLDFGRESDGRLAIESDSDSPMHIEAQYGESSQEAEHEPYLGVNEIDVAPHATAYGPKSAFRYVRLRFVGAGHVLRFKSLGLDDIYYPVHYRGSFTSSDALLNRIWEVGAYTAHLCMQDSIWDAPKRDRGRWMGDLDVSGRVIDDVFADRFLMQDTLNRLLHDAAKPIREDVNSIPGYSAFWVMGEADYYLHLGDRAYLQSIHDGLVALLSYMETELDRRSLFVNARNAWTFVDWSPDLDGKTAEAARATHLEFYAAFSEGAWLLREMGDQINAARFQNRATTIKSAANTILLDPRTNTFGNRWQTNAMAVFSGVADARQTAAIWQRVLSRPSQFVITPYYNYYVISAMARAGHRREALDWIRKYWGGMIQEGATSFWEAYDLSWPKDNYHVSLQADDGQGYFVSLSHGWSSGPTAWLSEEVLGIKPLAAGFTQAMIRPDLLDLQWARGSVPALQGDIRVAYQATPSGPLSASIDLPAAVDARVAFPVAPGRRSVIVNGEAVNASPTEGGTRLLLRLASAGHYELR